MFSKVNLTGVTSLYLWFCSGILASLSEFSCEVNTGCSL